MSLLTLYASKHGLSIASQTLKEIVKSFVIPMLLMKLIKLYMTKTRL